jgi:hypothetical protein
MAQRVAGRCGSALGSVILVHEARVRLLCESEVPSLLPVPEDRAANVPPLVLTRALLPKSEPIHG